VGGGGEVETQAMSVNIGVEGGGPIGGQEGE